MEWLNYRHLLYFWVVSREGSIVKATGLKAPLALWVKGVLTSVKDARYEKIER